MYATRPEIASDCCVTPNRALANLDLCPWSSSHSQTPEAVGRTRHADSYLKQLEQIGSSLFESSMKNGWGSDTHHS
jgi:hypothetical protein